ncbi:MAG: type II toxin-antitoxin system RelE/ParE family toxin [Candidatus Competibacteraceae bacterium]
MSYQGDCWFFVFGFEKKVRANVSAQELAALQALATDLLKLSSTELDHQVERNALSEMGDDPTD